MGKRGGYDYRYYHGVRVARYAFKIAKAENLEIDQDALYIAGLFHDIKKVEAIDDQGEIQYESTANKNHEKISSQYLSKYLEQASIPQKTIEKATQIIKGDGATESKILNDADELGSFGYLQAFKASTFATLSKKGVNQVLKHWLSKDEYNLKKSEAKIEDLNYKTSKKVAKKRISNFKNFLYGLKEEEKGDDI